MLAYSVAITTLLHVLLCNPMVLVMSSSCTRIPQESSCSYHGHVVSLARGSRCKYVVSLAVRKPCHRPCTAIGVLLSCDPQSAAVGCAWQNTHLLFIASRRRHSRVRRPHQSPGRSHPGLSLRSRLAPGPVQESQYKVLYCSLPLSSERQVSPATFLALEQ